MIDYNKHMGCVDRKEDLIGNYNNVRKLFKQNVKVIFYFMKEVVVIFSILFDKEKLEKFCFQNEHYQ